jgi:hypothetical protein
MIHVWHIPGYRGECQLKPLMQAFTQMLEQQPLFTKTLGLV